LLEIFCLISLDLFEIGERYWFEFNAIGTDGYHVPIVVRRAPRYSPSKVIKIIYPAIYFSICNKKLILNIVYAY
jgi:hypothetical protein